MMDRWNNHSNFFNDSGQIRTAASHNKRQYLENYNASDLSSRANGTQHADINLNLNPQHPGYDTTYRITDTQVSVLAAGCVWHYLEPVNDPAARAILVFRGTATHPAEYRDRKGRLNVEPVGAWAGGNFNFKSVASFSYRVIKYRVFTWMNEQAAEDRDITAAGYSLGGCLAMRVLQLYTKEKRPRWEKSELYAFTAPDLTTTASAEFTNLFQGRYTQLHTYWHVDDLVPVTGHYPTTTPRAYSSIILDGVVFLRIGALHTHLLLFISVQQGWDVALAYPVAETPLKPNALNMKRKIIGFMRRFP
ncbi:uncharacterized protein Triagg1_2018 [Trichoderma aggressivum f. europaeum]|uniref:Fungal lipase-type domain-containing protein n=1 Tax=Trichoderma aggressivum f. europaeum TaxID=173218 RepID=A0AAE1IKJ0_9HYPO|nr:hypothetical protein Triagg1_2018 [Trichoderma aggressivum f. europaeum]